MELDTKTTPSSISNNSNNFGTFNNGLSLLASISINSGISSSNNYNNNNNSTSSNEDNHINSIISSVVNNTASNTNHSSSNLLQLHYPHSNNSSNNNNNYYNYNPLSNFLNNSSDPNKTTSGFGGIKMGGEDSPNMHHSASGGDGNNLMDMEHLRPDMVPITVRSDLPQLKDITIEKVLCGTNLTWDEFLHLFHVSLDPNLHIVKGSGGRKANLLDKVGDYVRILKRRMKVYLVNIELVHPMKKLSKSSNSSVTSSNNATITNSTTSNSHKRGKNGSLKNLNNNNNNNNTSDHEQESSTTSKRKAKKPKWIKTTDEEIVPKSSTSQIPINSDSIEIPEKSVSMETQVFSNSNSNTGLGTTGKAGKGKNKKQNRKNAKNNNNTSLLNTSSVAAAAAIASASSLPLPLPSSTPSLGFLDNLSQMHINSNEALNLINTSQSPPSKLRSTLEGYMNLSNNPNDLPMFPLNFSNNNGSQQINDHDNDLTSSSSNGDNDEETTLDTKSEDMFGIGEFDIKPAVVQFLVHKISNKNMLRIREELMNLKNADDYFKLTCVAPLAAGLLEQMFCRNQPKNENN